MACAALPAAVTGVGLATATPAFAIPSPELVVGTLSSVSQLFTLFAALLGGGALAAGAAGAARRGGTAGRSKLPGWLAMGALVALCVSLYGNWHQYSTNSSGQRARLEATLLRPASLAGQPRNDSSLKELSFAQQLRHRQGISTEQTAKVLAALERGEASDTVIIDVRETAETAMGHLPGAIAARYADFDTLKLDLKSKKVVMFCHNGDRSHATCEQLAARGIDCRFVVGGLEKWVTEGRPMTGVSARSLDTLRALPPYPAQRVLLDTPEVHDLVKQSGAVFVDVRTAPEFAASHLPNAVNLPIRRLTSAQVAESIARLPNKPIVMPCYDRRSCFFAEVLGYELDKAGRDVRGRYTVPWDYFQAPSRPPYVEQWIKQSQGGLWDKAVRATADLVTSLAGVLGLIGAIFASALLSRLAVLPFSLKADRDQLVSTAIAPQIEGLKQRLGGDPVRLSRAIGQVYKRHGLTPLRNMIALVFVPVLALLSLAVQRVAEAMPTPLLWINNIAQHDPLYVMPLLAAGALGVYLHWAFVTTWRHGLTVWLLAVPVLAGSLALLGAAVNIYILSSALLLLLQRLIVGKPAQSEAALGANNGPVDRHAVDHKGVIPLSAVDSLRGCGNKAYRLAQMKAAGVNVPDGLVLTGALLAQMSTSTEAGRAKVLDKAWRTVGATKVAVRSSASAEDGAAHSFAGVFESVIDVDRKGFAEAVAHVTQSFDSARAKTYGADAGAANVFVQKMVPAKYAGVMFTRDPVAAGLMLVEYVEGTADGLVSGERTPVGLRFGRLTLALHADGTDKPPVDLKPLLEIGRKAEAMFGGPQDIEWAYAKGRFWIVQSRDIVGSPPSSDAATRQAATVQADWARVVDAMAGRPINEPALVQNELTELLPQPTALSVSLMEGFWASGGSLDIACSRLGMSYPVEEDAPPYLVTVLGHLYVDRREMTKRSPKIGGLALSRMRRAAEQVEREFRDDFLPAFLTDMRLSATIDYDRLATSDLLAELKRRRTSFIEKTHVEVDIVNVLTQLYMDDARRELEKLGLDAMAHLVPHEPNEMERVLHTLQATSAEDYVEVLHDGLGHRAVLDYELSERRHGEDRAAFESREFQLPANARTERVVLPAAAEQAADRARRYQVLKEDAKHHMLRELALIRRIALAIDRRFGLGGLVFHLTLDEIAQLQSTARESLVRLAGERHAHRQALATAPSPAASLTPAEVERASSGLAEVVDREGKLGGSRVSGSSVVRGRARVIDAQAAAAGAPIEDFQQGDIIVARMINPAWQLYLPKAGGLVCEIGGWLSHTALLAREYDLMMITGVKGLSGIPDKSEIVLYQDGSIEVQQEQIQNAAE